MQQGVLIDVWEVGSFDGELLSELRANADLVRNYIEIDRAIYLEREASGLRAAYRANPQAVKYQGFVESIGRQAETRTIRAWHYTRLTDAEVEQLRAGGISLSSLETTRRRLDAQVAVGEISADIADALYAASPFHHPEQVGPRSGKFWMTSHPVEIGDGGVEPLLSSWGGEAVYFWLQDPQLKVVVAGLGKPRIIEVAVPLEATRHAYAAGKAIVATFALSIGCTPDHGAFDLYVTRALGPEAVLAVHTEGEAGFAQIGKP
jgi:hypothetical protein